MGWTDAGKKHGAGGGGKFLKLKESGDSAKIVVMGPPHISHYEYQGQAQKSFPVAVYNVDEQAPQIFGMSPGCFSTLAPYIDKYGTGKIYEITRNGTGKDTRWMVMPEPLDDALKATIDDEEPYDVPTEVDGAQPILAAHPGPEPSQAGGPDDDIPFRGA